MVTYCNILRTNRTLAKIKVKDKQDDFKFEGGLYFIRREKIFLDRTTIRGKIKPTLLYMEGISDPLYLDNLSIKEYEKDVIVVDEKGQPVLNPYTHEPKTVKRKVREIQDTFIDSRAIHNMTDKKILSVLSATPDLTLSDIVLVIIGIAMILLVIADIVISSG